MLTRSTVLITAFFTAIALLFNHLSVDLAIYDPQSPQQQESIAAGQLETIGPIAYSIDGDFGSVSAPPSLANTLRAWIIDIILLGQLLLIIKLLKK